MMDHLCVLSPSTDESIGSIPFRHVYQYRPPFSHQPAHSASSVASSSSASTATASSIPMNPIVSASYGQSSAYASSLGSLHAIQYEGAFAVMPFKIYRDPYLPHMGFEHAEGMRRLAKLSSELFDIKSPQEDLASLPLAASTSSGSGFFSAFRRNKSSNTAGSPSSASARSPCASPTLSTASSIASGGSSSSSARSRGNALIDEYFRKSCHSLLKPNNNFISKWIVSPRLAAKEPALYELFRNRAEPTLPKTDAQEKSEDTLYFLFHYVGSILMWRNLFGFDLDEPLMEIHFAKLFPTCVAHYCLTKSFTEASMVDDEPIVMAGFHNGEIMLWHLLESKYARFNKSGMYNASAVTELSWIPESESHFIASFKNGSVIIFDRFKDELPFTYHSTEPDDLFHVVHPNKQHRSNPMSIWHITKRSVCGLEFSPDMRHIAIVSSDGFLRVVDVVTERLLDTFQGYFGGMLCVAWSPDGQLFVSGGEDDLVSVWSFKEKRLIARGYGHQSFVSSIAFGQSRCEHVYKFASVGQDSMLCLWELSLHSLPPLAKPRPCPESNSSISSPFPTSSTIKRGSFQISQIHPSVASSYVPRIDPTICMVLDDEPLTNVAYVEASIVLRTLTGNIKILSTDAI